MLEVRLTSAARHDLGTIWSYVADKSVSAAERLLEGAGRRFELLARNPELGEIRKTVNGLESRWFSFQQYAIYDQATDDGLIVLRVLHGARDQEATLIIDD
ncbi:type II toxin-antitoxin system RelE/ParE family toxin [Blastopirellula retiformator]|uniref:type II toxin-antitoxin system RelE/ParE family toxin n=1 Tax=Blastopirellula retiformator TaxID=2527970 RepID=UPI0011B80BCE|nr:type II toxin-antitoxin system RelE/ParE family toxin [Blastopirellula retiformator]